MSRPCVTIGLPVLNAQDTLRLCIQSIYAQTLQDWELIVVDDGSTDASWSMLQAIRDTRVIVLRDGANRGLAWRLNQITECARAPYIARMDADDVMHPERLSRQIGFIENARDLDVVSSAAYIIDQTGTVRRGGCPIKSDLAAFLLRSQLLHPTVLARTEWFTRYPYDTTIGRAEDHELWCRVCGHAKFGFIDECLLFYTERYSLRSYLSTFAGDFKVILKHGPKHHTISMTARASALQTLKGAVAIALLASHAHGCLARLRSDLLPPEQVTNAQEIIKRIAKISVPGWSTIEPSLPRLLQVDERIRA